MGKKNEIDIVYNVHLHNNIFISFMQMVDVQIIFRLSLLFSACGVEARKYEKKGGRKASSMNTLVEAYRMMI